MRRPGRIVDLGCGTGAMLEALSWRHPESAFVGVDGSRELLAIAEAQTYGAGDVRFVRGDVVEPPESPGEATTVIFSSVLHEVHSYAGYSRARVRQALASAVRCLAPGGRLLLRDGVRPSLEDEVRLRCREDDDSPLGSTRDRFLRFAREFKGGPPVGGIPFREDGRRFRLSRPDAAEFLSKKDYVEHWALEVREEFGVFPLAGWRAELEALGLQLVHAAEYVSPWIRAHRFEGRVWLEARGADGAWVPTDFPATHFVVAAERR